MYRLFFFAATLSCCSPLSAAAQFFDGFTDGDFTANPAWTGTTDRWSIVPFDGDPALRSDGAATPDTLFLATPSAVSRGTWTFTFATRHVNLSNFNGARVFLMADTDGLDGAAHGYFLQLGAGNSDEIRLYRQDGDATSKRVLLGQSAEPLLAGDSLALTIAVIRSPSYTWTVAVDGTPIFTASDSTYTTSRFFGVWVKHTAATAQSYVFDDFDVQGEAGPADNEPPRLVNVEAVDAGHIEVTFSEPVEGCHPERYEISNGIGTPTVETCLPEEQATYTLLTAHPLVNGTTYTLTVRDIADSAGNVRHEATRTFIFIAPDSPPPQTGDVVINEIYYDPPDASLEFIEVFNRSDAFFDLRRFGIADDHFEPIPVQTEPAVIVPGDYVVLVRDGDAFAAAFPGVAFIEPSSWATLNDGGDTVVLFFENTVLDAVPYRPGWGGNGVSLERKDPDGPSDHAFNFGSSIHEAGATPGTANSIYAPDRSPPTLLFAEQVNDDEVDVYLDEPVAAASVQPAAFTLDDGRSPVSIITDEDTHLRLHFDAPPTGHVLTVNALTDLTGNTVGDARINLAYLADPGDLVVNEIMYDPRADRYDDQADQPEYVELYNRSRRRLTLHRHYWTNQPDEAGRADTVRFGASLFSIAPDRFAVIYSDPAATPDPAGGSMLTRAFPEVNDVVATATLIPLARSSLGLANSGALIHLHRPDDAGLDSVAYHPSWHHPNLIDATGVALERLTPEDPTNDLAHWTSSVAPSGGTPGRLNSVTLASGEKVTEGSLLITPSPFSPDRDGFDDVTAIRYALAQAATLLRVRIFDARGRLVRSLTEAHLAGAAGQLLWDGLDDAGHPLRIGIYVVLFEALDAAGGTVVAFKEPVVLARSLD